jgi:hypothetical protein
MDLKLVGGFKFRSEHQPQAFGFRVVGWQGNDVALRCLIGRRSMFAFGTVGVSGRLLARWIAHRA